MRIKKYSKEAKEENKGKENVWTFNCNSSILHTPNSRNYSFSIIFKLVVKGAENETKNGYTSDDSRVQKLSQRKREKQEHDR